VARSRPWWAPSEGTAGNPSSRDGGA